MEIRKVERRRSFINIGLQGPSGSGKTYSAILLAKGLASSLKHVCIIDTENGSADLYAHLGDYSIIVLKPPYTPDKYVNAIALAEDSGFKVAIIDSISHCWEYLIQYHASLTGNSFTNWSKITPLYKLLVNKILGSRIHTICTLRTKQDYIINKDGLGKMVLEKVGLKAIQREGFEYELTIMLSLAINHRATVSKDRTQLFTNDSSIITEEHGRKIFNWCNEGVSIEDVKLKIKSASTLTELSDLYRLYPVYTNTLKEDFSVRKSELQSIIISQVNFNQNGSAINQ